MIKFLIWYFQLELQFLKLTTFWKTCCPHYTQAVILTAKQALEKATVNIK